MYKSFLLTMLAWAPAVACRPSDILDVPPPGGEFTSSAVQGPAAALQFFQGARAQLSMALGRSGRVIQIGGLLSDELTARNLYAAGNASCEGSEDARYTSLEEPQGCESEGDNVLTELLLYRSNLVLARVGLQQYAATIYPATIGEAFALTGYTELFLAEDYCAGIPLSQAQFQGGWSYGAPLTQDSLLKTAETDFDSALVYANASSNDTIQALAEVGLARTLLNRDSTMAAAAAVNGVPTGFVYNGQLEPLLSNGINGEVNYWELALYTYVAATWTVADGDGFNGLNFVSATDPRLVLDSTLAETDDGRSRRKADSVLYYPLKFGNPSTGLIPIATGMEARLIQAEAALAANPNDLTWLSDLNSLRSAGCPDTATTNASCPYGTAQISAQPYGLLPLTDPGLDSSRVKLLFRERAFWLFGTGTRLGDLRRLVRNYGPTYHWTPDDIFPTGVYGTGVKAGLQSRIANYGSDVSLTLPTSQSGTTITNPNYKGCLPGGGTTVA